MKRALGLVVWPIFYCLALVGKIFGKKRDVQMSVKVAIATFFLAAIAAADVLPLGPIRVDWDANDPAFNVTEYRLFVDGIEAGRTGETSFEIRDLDAGSHSLTVTAVNAAGESPPSEPVNFELVAVPLAPQNIHVSAASITLHLINPEPTPKPKKDRKK